MCESIAACIRKWKRELKLWRWVFKKQTNLVNIYNSNACQAEVGGIRVKKTVTVRRQIDAALGSAIHCLRLMCVMLSYSLEL